MNYITLNGMSSRLVDGLVIQELPPVSKPLMRTEILQIDGRDGDIVNKLGYSAYDKELKIGLSRNWDIDDVISYFASEGEVTFSNEPDKYYRYQILEQIDFERLVRFRQAIVTFHVQPYKFSIVDQPLVKEFEETDEKTMTIGSFGNTIAKPQITITGSGNIVLTLNGAEVFTIALGDTEYITIDAEKMEASQGGILRNRLVTGNYDNFVLQVGSNILTWTGNIEQISISNYSRWI